MENSMLTTLAIECELLKFLSHEHVSFFQCFCSMAIQTFSSVSSFHLEVELEWIVVVQVDVHQNVYGVVVT